MLTEGAGGDKRQQQPFCVVSTALILFQKSFREFAVLRTQPSHSRLRFPLPTPSLTALQIIQRRNNWVTVLPQFSLAWKLYWKTPNKHLSHFNTPVIMSVLNNVSAIRIYLGFYIQVLGWKRCCIPTLSTDLDHLIQTPQPTCRSRGWYTALLSTAYTPTSLTLDRFSDATQPYCQFPISGSINYTAFCLALEKWITNKSMSRHRQWFGDGYMLTLG